MPDCIDLADHYGDQFKIISEDGSRTTDPWLQILLCKRGHICPYGGSMLLACTDRRGRNLIKQLLAVPSARIVQDGDDGVNVVFHVDQFEGIAAIMRPRKRRPHLSPEHRAKLIAANAMYRFTDGSEVLHRDGRRTGDDQPTKDAA